MLHCILDPDADFLQVVWPLVKGKGEAFEEFVFVEGFEVAVAFLNLDAFVKELFESTETMATMGTFPASADAPAGIGCA